MKIRAKFTCQFITQHAYGGEDVHLSAVVCRNGENAQWAKATPSGKIDMTIDNSDARGAFVPGKEYWVDFTPCEGD